MKILIFSDVHWSINTSILQSRGSKYSTRLELLIKSMNWVNSLAKEQGCKIMICAGDMMDKSFCTDEEITALNEILWNDLDCYYLVGNHESSVNSLAYSSTNLLSGANSFIIDKCDSISIGKTLIDFVPYIKDTNNVRLSNLVSDSTNYKKHIVISHNDIMGIQYGEYCSKIGFSIEDIESCCDLYLNGHLHNQEWVTKKILNVGSLSAHNFSNDSFRYKYGVWIYDTDKDKIVFYENPYSLHFYKINIGDNIASIAQLHKIEENSIVALKYSDKLVKQVDAAVDSVKDRLLMFKRIIDVTSQTGVKEQVLVNLEYTKQFYDFMIDTLGDTDIVREELSHIIA